MDLIQPIIPRDNTYVMSSRKLSVHSEDRDIKRWANSNHFAIDIPANITNVTSLLLVSSTFPSNQKVISELNENTRLTMKLYEETYTIVLDEGTYNPLQLANELTFKLNNIDSSISGFKVIYNEIQQRFLFSNDTSSFTFVFSSRDDYESVCGSTSPIYENHSKWGLGYNLGFNNKEDYTAEEVTVDVNFGYLDDAGTVPIIDTSTASAYVLYADVNPRLLGDTSIYMEIKYYNQYDEMIPYSETNNTAITASNRSTVYTRNDGVRGTMNSAFAKIPMTTTSLSISYQPFTNNIGNISKFDEPINRLSRLEFKFRYHNGKLVDFQDYPFEFTLEIRHLVDEIFKGYKVRH